MAWVRVDDAFYDHPKFVALTPGAVGLWVIGLAYCNRNLTDGFIHNLALPRLLADDMDTCVNYANELVAVGTWEEIEEGYQVVNYLEFQPSAAEVRQQREVERQRKAEWRARKADKRLSREASQRDNDGSPADVPAMSRSIPTPTPTPKVKSETRASALPPDFTPTDEQRQWAATVIRASQIDGETQKFIDHFTANGKRMKDWNAAWRNWIRRSREFDRQAPSDFRPAVVGSKCPEHPRMTEPCATCASERAAGIRKDTA